MAAPRKSERLMNLVICLLVSHHFVPKARVRQLVEDYREQTPEAFEKMFERDKDELRDLGIPIEVGSVASGFDDEVGYRIRRSEFELPPLTFTAQEAAVLGLAARVWEHASLAEATSRAVLKLGADGFVAGAAAAPGSSASPSAASSTAQASSAVPGQVPDAGADVRADTGADTGPVTTLEPRLPASEPAFEPLWRSVQSRTVVSFDYRRPGAGGAQHRTLEPWGILNWRSRWYVLGHDRDRAATRMFRLSRIAGPVRPVGRPGAFTVPEGVDIRAEAARMSPQEELRRTARIRVRAGAGHGLRRRASSVSPDGSGWDVLEVGFSDPVTLAEEIAGYAAGAVALDPPDLREAVIRHLKGLLVEVAHDG
ncbi:helix-turn-helix transcriptional regulator [Actinopolymorpha rutila]|uniref:Putative DNA-binding transcriptional regulator YafY n=1 Tax=Actinopolymorpha rutila TaxID=446787 RepID=A0A852ZNJ4_9ACTN|nr:putative DNA-binding transcriptional regulator YafY [Actinopolymorpha rutila]